MIAILITVILSLLGISFLFLAQTENQISRNEKLADQGLYVAEAGARLVKRWFDDPGTALGFPEPTDVDRSLRQIIDESDPYGAPVATSPLYKQGVDLDGDSKDDLFRKPYRGAPTHLFLGARDGPDLRIDDGTAAGKVFLETLSTTLFADFPAEGGGLVARISRIDLFAPPYVREGANWSRFGVATVRVTGRIYRDTGTGTIDVFAEREIETTLSEIPYFGPHGPVHSCRDTTWTGAAVDVHWGTMSSVGASRFTPGMTFPDGLAKSVPRDLPAAPRMDVLWNTSDPAVFATYKNNAETNGVSIEDPWFRVVSGASIFGAPLPIQPYPPSSVNGTPNADDHSNLLQNQPLIVCPPYSYDLWRNLATSGERGVHFYAWDGAGFREDGVGPSRTVRQITDGREGIYFFDTADGLPPTDTNGDAVPDNLTPPVVISGGTWSFRGFLYLNATSFQLSGVGGVPTVLNPPGEPYQDLDLDDVHDAGENYLNLAYPTTAAAAPGSIRADPVSPGVPSRDIRGPDIPDVPVSLHGILMIGGAFQATGSGTIYGTVVAHQGVTQSPDDGTAATPRIYWDQSIVDDWPPPGWRLPRVTVTGWN